MATQILTINFVNRASRQTIGIIFYLRYIFTHGHVFHVEFQSKCKYWDFESLQHQRVLCQYYFITRFVTPTGKLTLSGSLDVKLKKASRRGN